MGLEREAERTNKTEIPRFIWGYDLKKKKKALLTGREKPRRGVKEATGGLGGARGAPASSGMSARCRAVREASGVILRT